MIQAPYVCAQSSVSTYCDYFRGKMFVLAQELKSHHCWQTGNFTDNHLLHRQTGQVQLLSVTFLLNKGAARR